MKKILITGATGYIGRRLKRRLLGRTDLAIRLLVRNSRKVEPSTLARLEVVEGDTFNREALHRALDGVEIAFYLIHSMGAGQDFEERDRRSAENFRNACLAAGVRRLIYLGGLGVRKTASRHLLSRLETGEILSGSGGRLQTVWLRAGTIIGSGSASFEIIRNLVEKLPIMVTPKWVYTRTQPIAADDVLSYLEASITLETQESLIIDIGAEPVNFKEMLANAAKIMGLRRLLVPVPVLSPKLSSYWLLLLTPVPFAVAAALVEGLRSETVVLNDHASRYFPDIIPMSYDQAVRLALKEMEEDQVVSRWCDSSGDALCDIMNHDDTHSAIFRDRREIELQGISPASVFRAVLSIGGKAGWFSYHSLWQLRGLLDKLAGGYGLNRGRRQKQELRQGDALDFWKVVDIKRNKRLLLLAQMKLPGKGWLEFDIQPDKLVQTAHFRPHGVAGRLYWYSVLPLHSLVFDNLARNIVARAGDIEKTRLPPADTG